METRYLIVQSDSLPNAKLKLKDLILGLGYLEANYKYIVGESNIGYANETIIRNNTVLTDWKNGNFCFTFDCHIVEDYGAAISIECGNHTDIFWCVGSCHCEHSEPIICSCGASECICTEEDLQEAGECSCLDDRPECSCEAPDCICADLVQKYMPVMEVI